MIKITPGGFPFVLSQVSSVVLADSAGGSLSIPRQSGAATDPKGDHQNQNRQGIEQHVHRRIVVHDDKTNNRRHANIDKIT